MKVNTDKCQFPSALDMASTMTIEIFTIQNSASQKILDITIDKYLNFNDHVFNLCKTVSLKITAITRFFLYITVNQRRTLLKAYFMSHFVYCPLVWMNHSRSLNKRINTIHERALRLVYNDFTSSFTELLKKYNSVAIHLKNLQNLAIEMFKVKHNLAPEMMTEVFRLKTRFFNTRHKSEFQHRNVKTVIYGFEILLSLGPQIWNFITIEFRNLTSLNAFKSKIKSSLLNNACVVCVKKYISIT